MGRVWAGQLDVCTDKKRSNWFSIQIKNYVRKTIDCSSHEFQSKFKTTTQVLLERVIDTRIALRFSPMSCAILKLFCIERRVRIIKSFAFFVCALWSLATMYSPVHTHTNKTLWQCVLASGFECRVIYDWCPRCKYGVAKSHSQCQHVVSRCFVTCCYLSFFIIRTLN